MIDYRVLGPLAVSRDGETVDLGQGKQRALLALLLLHANEQLSPSRLIDLLWYEPPSSAGKILQNLVVRLRRLLPEGSLLTRGRAYELRVGPGELDVDRFMDLLERGRKATTADAFDLLSHALAEWRGEPLCDVGEAPFVGDHVRRLESLRLGAAAERAEAALALGRADDVVDELEKLVAEHPLQERLRAQLMLALYRSGRQAQALEAYREGRHALVEELGVEPGPALRQLEQAILRQDPELESPPVARARVASRRRPTLVAVGVALAAVIGLAATLAMRGSGSAAGAGKPPNSVAVIDPATNRVTSEIAVGTAPSSIAVGAGSVWVGNIGDGTVTRIDMRGSRALARAIAVSSPGYEAPTAIAVASGSLWALSSGPGSLTRVPVYAGSIQLGSIDEFELPQADRYLTDYLTMAAGHGRLWLASTHFSAVFEFEPGPGLVRHRIAVPGQALGVAVDSNAVWCITARAGGGFLARIDPAAHAVAARTRLPATPTAVATGFGRVWVAVSASNLVFEVDPATNSVVRTISVPGGPVAIVAGAGGVWVATGQTRRLVRLDPERGTTAATLKLAGIAHGLAVAGGRVWVAGA